MLGVDEIRPGLANEAEQPFRITRMPCWRDGVALIDARKKKIRRDARSSDKIILAFRVAKRADEVVGGSPASPTYMNASHKVIL
jgi:hypothetical protein